MRFLGIMARAWFFLLSAIKVLIISTPVLLTAEGVLDRPGVFYLTFEVTESSENMQTKTLFSLCMRRNSKVIVERIFYTNTS